MPLSFLTLSIPSLNIDPLRVQKWMAVVWVIIGMCLPVFGQTPGSASGVIAGKVVNPGGIALTQAEVIAVETSTGLERKISVNDRGDFVLSDLPPGSYEVTVQAGDCESPRVATEVRVSEVSRMTLVCGAQAEAEVEVRAGNSRLFGDTASSSVVTQTQIQGLPINRRVFTDFVVINPRVREERLVNQGIFRSTGFSSNGQLTRSNNVQIDGFDNNDPVSGAYRSFFSSEAVREFQIVTDGYSAEFGRATAAVLNVVTRSGSNEFNGSVFGVFRNEMIAARNAFAKNQTNFEQDQFGASVGGPIKTNRAYFFAAGERQTIQDTVVVAIPERIVNVLHNRGYTWVRTGPQPVGIATSSILGRVDVDITERNRLTVRYNYAGNRDGAAQGFGGTVDRSFGGTLEAAIHDGGIRNVWSSASGKWVAETRLGFGDQDFFIRGGEVVGIRLSGIATGGQIDTGQNGYSNHTRSNRVFQISQTVSGFIGNHSVRFGGDVLRYGNRVKLGYIDYGRFTYLDLDLRYLGLPGDGFIGALEAFEPTLRSRAQRRFLTALAPLLPFISKQSHFPDDLPLAEMPIPAVFAQGYSPTYPANVNQNNLAAFVQDDWRIKDNVMLKFGGRLDHFAVHGFSLPGVTFTPRLGISWVPKKLSKLVVNIGYGAYANINPASGVGANGTDAYEPGNLDSDIARFLIYVAPDSLPFALSHPQGFGRLILRPNDLPISAPFKAVDSIDRNIPKLPITHQASIKIGWQFQNIWFAETTYVWSRGNRIFTPAIGYNIINPETQQLPFPNLGSVAIAGFAGDSYYNGLTISLERRLAVGWYLSFHYTFSKAIDNSGDFSSQEAGVPNDAIQNFRRLDRSLSFLDLRHRCVGNFRIESPFSSTLLKNWGLSGLIILESGSPYNLTVGADTNGDGNTTNDRPLVNGVPLARNAGIRPGFAQVDLRLTRGFELGRSLKLDFFADVFNLLNRVNVRQINNTYPIQPDGSFNLPTPVNGRYPVTQDRYRSAFAPRQFQIGFRLRF